MSLARRTRYFAQRARRARIAKRGKKKKISQKYSFLLPSSRASRKMPRLPRLANKAPVMQARITMNCNTKTAKKTLFFTVLLVQQHLDTVIIIKVSRITIPKPKKRKRRAWRRF